MTSPVLPLTAFVVSLGVAFGAVPAPAAPVPAQAPAKAFDFDGDGRQDVAISSPGNDSSGGFILLAQSSSHGALTPSPSRVGGSTRVLTSGDFNGDGYADLVSVVHTGSSRPLLYLDYATHKFGQFSRGTGVQSHPDRDVDDTQIDDFGHALATGDFNGDGLIDLAIGDPTIATEQVSGQPDTAVTGPHAGDVTVRYGRPTGLYLGSDRAPGQYEIWDENTTNVSRGAEDGDAFGSSLAAGDLNGDGIDDLVVGIPGKSIASHPADGAVTELLGASGGLSTKDTHTFNLLTPGVRGRQVRDFDCDSNGCTDVGERFGKTVTTGDFDGDGYDDVAIGIPQRQIVKRGAPDDMYAPLGFDGALSILYGASVGLTARSQFMTLNSRGVPGRVTEDSPTQIELGLAMSAGDYNADGAADLVAAVYDERAAGVGALLYFPGSDEGLRNRSSRRFDEDSRGVESKARPDEGFALSLLTADVTSDGTDDLLVGAPGDFVAGAPAAGAAYVFTGGHHGVVAARSHRYSERTDGFGGIWEHDDNFGLVGSQVIVP